MSTEPEAGSEGGRPSERLFVALPAPDSLAAALARLQPGDADGVRLLAPADMHVTLHFLGQAPVAPVAAALGRIEAPAFPVRLSAAGHFALRGGRKILWVGIEPTAPLIDLHAQAAAVLAGLGFEAEVRPFVPHITLARLAPGAPRGTVAAFEGQTLPEAAREFHCERFALYASETTAEGARYRILERFPLES